MWTVVSIFVGLIICPYHDAAKTEKKGPLFNCYGKPNHQFQCADGLTCAPISTRCDGTKWCPDGSDEWDCEEHQCGEDEHRCRQGKCIPKWFVCDGKDDCNDGSGGMFSELILTSDEDSRCGPTVPDTDHCYKHLFWCKEGDVSYGCTSWYNVCNGQDDCYGGSDEEGCKNHHCLHRDDHRCDEGRCIPNYFVCDGVQHCADGSDEKVCNCFKNQFRCANGDCIPLSWRCDQITSCKDGSDEVGCDAHQCDETRHFRCDSGQCVQKEAVCDEQYGSYHCSDYSDQFDSCRRNPSKPKKCLMNQFNCPASHECYSQFQRCDGKNDCRDGSDEWHCVEQNRCPGGWHRCSNGRCVAPLHVCDGKVDCRDDNSDEKNCE